MLVYRSVLHGIFWESSKAPKHFHRFKRIFPKKFCKRPPAKTSNNPFHTFNKHPTEKLFQPTNVCNEKTEMCQTKTTQHISPTCCFSSKETKKTTIKFQKINLHKTQLTHQKTKNLRVSKLTQRNLSQGPPASTRSNTMVPALHASARKSKNSSGVFYAVRNPARRQQQQQQQQQELRLKHLFLKLKKLGQFHL